MTSELRVAVIGSGGQIGHDVVSTCATLGRIIQLGRGEMAVDLARPETIGRALDRVMPNIIVNAAAYTAVDKAEDERDLAFTINGTAPGVMAEWAAAHDAVLIHYSTDYVFDGAGTRPYVEDDPTAPSNAYGESKLAGETAITAVGGKYILLRTSWIYGARGSNFLLTMLRLAREREELRVVNDQTGAPTWCREVARATSTILVALLKGDAVDPWGLYHLTASGQTTWYDFARRILELDPNRGEHLCKSVVPVNTAEFPTPAKRPAYSVLDCSRAENHFGIALPDWKTQLKGVMASIPA